MLAYMGDKYFVDHVINSFTVEEYGKVLSNLKDAISDVPFSRYRNGRCRDCIPEDDAYCFFDVIKLLMTDPDAYFYPLHHQWKYKRIGKKAERKENDGPYFKANNTPVSFNKLVWHSTRLNLSVQAKIEGTVDLSDVPIKISDIAEVHKVMTELGEEVMRAYPTFQHRNYTLVEDGHYNIKNLYITASDSVIDLLKLRNLITPTDNESIFKLNFEELPVINRNISNEAKVSAETYAKLFIELLECKANMKVYRKFSKEKEESETDESTVSQFLLKNGFRKDGSFDPPKSVALNENCDFHTVNALELKAKGCSTLPSVDAVIKKRDTNKRLTLTDELISNAIDSMEGRDVEKLIKETKERILVINHQLNRCKFGLLMSKQWFEDFDTIEKPVVVVPLNGHQVDVTFVLAKEKVFFN